LESQSPASSFLLTDKAFGSYGVAPSFCITTGPFGGLQTTLSHKGCLARETSLLSAYFGYYSPEAVAVIMVSDYLFRKTGLHMIVFGWGLNQGHMG
jgi:hypothetical protein